VCRRWPADARTRNVIGQSIGIEGLSWKMSDQDLSGVVFTLSWPYNVCYTNSDQDIFIIDSGGFTMTTIHVIVQLQWDSSNL
jgi:hypothetical protein